MNKPQTAMAAMIALGGGMFLPPTKVKPLPAVKPCSNCGKPKQHNNMFCSAQCCKEYKSELGGEV